MTFQEVHARVRKVNDQLRAKGYHWDFIEDFWHHCIKEANQNKKVKIKQGAQP